MAEETNYTISELNIEKVPKLFYLGTFFVKVSL
ncbi:hypothetical protein CKL83_05545 [Bacillus anthracis]|uniref:Uncharacterized protein n=4 Tax=Bacillus cereus group TaxID=86661 RepID=A0A0F7RE02_BACAN|nr:hypothetical protein BA_1773 [Bacillus anthracis str. Ames]AAT30887.1 hypothetical protein GBAA_1773 [Bacillus anthracis str. 'Ames Ancestor']AIM05638.1 hypothetical protein BACvac02_1879 [Bacillus anthracis]EDR20392.1 hypothetical protein BAC_1787 [Bacillus anthracis str. A0488]EDR88634.1 hypothetical protein BAQ_1815 [Bacillus anthracis str. A0193]EDR94046.1 hypothetical protein BAH_1814 [Bacillus anthracis str. A0442]EDS96639.1 hypothetical protein BAK_1850 [Bacillus anthracis str. A038